MAGANPTLRRRQLATRLRELRKVAGLSIEEAANRLECSPAKISRIETAHRGVIPRDVRDLCHIYGVGQADAEALMTMAREARRPGWWQQYEDLDLDPYIGLEGEASSITMYETTTIPSLLQTEDYAREVIRGCLPRIKQEVLEERVDARLKRQRLLMQSEPPQCAVLLDESVLHRHVGGRAVMGAALERVVELSALAHVTVQVIPFTVGAHIGFDSMFIMLEFPDNMVPDTVYVESLMGDFYLEKPRELERFREVITHLRAVALDQPGSVALIGEMSRTYAV
ncbi:helix-turn-helix transcriptional regulator [Sphaerisporangium sp. TRM90804]|uniref:helix-turn-helix domain-containing protein n=1 Tax=Sphaerisporangium sp. TRM90804 TaxID=3031113 RepID=UPI00244D661A|nr:helix-turn-helix transcriptional regulator [Sphaerisporangium sp. TRM90804]MDH2428069.1 helix-turn-helix transcriptional regulator [Sphaerisporangium sp. TRM90804]